MIKKTFFLLYLGVISFPFATYAVTAPSNFKGLVDVFLGIIQTLVLLVFALTFITIIWKIVQSWIIRGGDAEGVEAGKHTVVVGVIALVVMSSVWGIIYVLRQGVFGG